MHVEPAVDTETWVKWRMTVLEEVFADKPWPDREKLKAANERYIRKHLQDNTCLACFLRDETRIAGCGGACLWQEMPSPENTDGSVGYLMSIYVVPSLRGRGYGEKIVHWLLCELKRRRVNKIMLETTPKGRPVYEKLGFVDADGYMILHEI